MLSRSIGPWGECIRSNSRQKVVSIEREGELELAEREVYRDGMIP